MARSVPTYALYGEQTAQSPDFWVHCETIATRSSAYQWEIALHRHENFFQLLYISAGAGDALLEDGKLPLEPPCVMLMPPGVSHGYRFTRDATGFVITVVADHFPLTAELQKRPGHWHGVPQLVSLKGKSSCDYLNATMSGIAEEFQTRQAGRDELIRSYLTTVLLLLGRLAGSQVRDASGDPRRVRVEALKDMIGRDFRTQTSATQYAQRLNLSPAHLNRIVKEVTGMTVHDLIMLRVRDEAERALVFSSATVQQIANDLGFADPAYFSRFFRKRTGQTPGTFRRLERQKLSEL